MRGWSRRLRKQGPLQDRGSGTREVRPDSVRLKSDGLYVYVCLIIITALPVEFPPPAPPFPNHNQTVLELGTQLHYLTYLPISLVYNVANLHNSHIIWLTFISRRQVAKIPT